MTGIILVNEGLKGSMQIKAVHLMISIQTIYLMEYTRMLNQSSLMKHFPEIDYMDYLEEIATSKGINVAPIDPQEIDFNFGAKLKCFDCKGYGKTFACPPYNPSLSSAKKKLKSFRSGFLLTRRDRFDYFAERMSREHGMKGKRLIGFSQLWADRVGHHSFNRAVLEMRNFLITLGISTKVFGSGGGCRLCRPCGAAKNASCKHPQKKLSSPESWGVDVYGTLKKCGVPIEIPPRTYLTRVGLILIGKKKGRAFDNNNKTSVKKKENNNFVKYAEDLPEETYFCFKDMQENKQSCENCMVKERSRCEFIFKEKKEIINWLKEKIIISRTYSTASELRKRHSFEVDNFHRTHQAWWAIGAFDFGKSGLPSRIRQLAFSGIKGLFCTRALDIQGIPDPFPKKFTVFIII